MEFYSFIVFILIVLAGAIIVLPIVTISKVNSLKNEIEVLNRKISDLLTFSKQTPTAEVTAAPQESKPVEIKEMQETVHVPEPQDEIVEELPFQPDYYTEKPLEETAFAQPAVWDDSISDAPADRKMNLRSIFEKFLGTNWLSKIGIVTLVLGIGFFVKYAIDQQWINEIGRVGIGLLTGAIIIGIAHKLQAKYHVFSSILTGGGISVLYITITLAFREYALFGQTIAFCLLIAVTVFSILLSLLYDRKELAIFSLLGGFASPLMVSTGIGNYVVLFSYILILNTGMLIVSFIKKWQILGIISYVLTLVFFWVWFINSYNNQFFSVSLFVTLFFIQFYLLALFDHFKSEKKISAYQVFLILTNNLSAYLAYIYIFEHYSFDIKGLITLSLAAVNAAVLIALFRNSRIDRNMLYLIIAIVLSFVSLAVPVQLKGHVITLFWAAESVILLWLWQKSRIEVFYIGFILILLLTLISYFMDINNLYTLHAVMPLMANRLFVTGAAVIAAFVVNMALLRREPTETNNRKQITRIFNLIILALAYIVPFIELDIQLAQHASMGYYESSSFRQVALGAFTIIYIAVLSIVYIKKVSYNKYIFGLLYAAVFFYAIFYSMATAALRSDIFSYMESIYPASYFAVHLLSLPAIACIVYVVIKNIKSLPDNQSVRLSWALTVLVVVIASVELDNIVIWIAGNPDNYTSTLHDVHTFGYPVLWGVIAMILMIWGLNRKEALLRQISLVFFGFIIIKFYAYDVWNMSQAGRILSFVLLGVILLLVSFMQQKIRTLVKNENETENNNIANQ